MARSVSSRRSRQAEQAPKAENGGVLEGLPAVGNAIAGAALNTDIGWLREHTRLLARALEWENASRVENRMLTGVDIASAKDWAARRPKGAPKPPKPEKAPKPPKPTKVPKPVKTPAEKPLPPSRRCRSQAKLLGRE